MATTKVLQHHKITDTSRKEHSLAESSLHFMYILHFVSFLTIFKLILVKETIKF